MCVDSMGQPLRRLNSNLSLHTDLSFPGTGGYPGMRMSLPQPADLGQSRTLPRCFLRQSSDSLASQGYPLGSSQQRFSQLMLNQQQNRFVSSTLTLPQVVAPKSQVQWPTAIPPRRRTTRMAINSIRSPFTQLQHPEVEHLGQRLRSPDHRNSSAATHSTINSVGPVL